MFVATCDFAGIRLDHDYDRWVVVFGMIVDCSWDGLGLILGMVLK